MKTKSEVFEVLKEIKRKCVPEHHFELKNLNIKLNAAIEKFNRMIQNLSVMNNIHNEQDTKMKSEMNQFYLNLKSQINQQSNDQSLMIKTLQEEIKSNKKIINELIANQSHEIEKSSEFQKFSSFITQQEPTFFFIALPSICLLTFFNIIMIYFCCYRKSKRNSFQRRARPVIV
ncbi:hypothetical protein PVAND_015562 [Polypedilum vanderplanki]|uniref:Uncharacterized protein n=1 Tax=Polypedilum vanderplanki TaxID=319348 RepID=A0A9J6BD09_POLVA|nr:hypothetical protein PVAND_015562 [Polypedilum vanderplanki]